MGGYQSPSLAAPHFQPDPAGLRALAARSEAGGAVGSARAGPIRRCRRPATPGGRAQTRAFSRAIGMRRGGRASRLVFSGPKAKAHGLPGALRRPEKAFSLVLLQAAASAPRPASSLEAIRASQRTSAGSVGTGGHGPWPRPTATSLPLLRAALAAPAGTRGVPPTWWAGKKGAPPTRWVLARGALPLFLSGRLPAAPAAEGNANPSISGSKPPPQHFRAVRPDQLHHLGSGRCQPAF